MEHVPYSKNHLFVTKDKNHLIFLPEGLVFHLPRGKGQVKGYRDRNTSQDYPRDEKDGINK
jgi:hypothetical protein